MTLLFRPLQLFMCLLWILLQLAVVCMYWDLPPLERGKSKEGSPSQSRAEGEESEQGLEEEDNEEEKPLMGSQELMGSYGSVVTSKPPTNRTTAAANSTLNHISPPPSPTPPDSLESSSPFKNFSISQGGWLTVPMSASFSSVHKKKLFSYKAEFICHFSFLLSLCSDLAGSFSQLHASCRAHHKCFYQEAVWLSVAMNTP